MIVASLLLIVAAAVLLVLGLVRDANLLLIVSIAISLVAAVALYLGARQARAADNSDDDEPGDTGRADEPTARFPALTKPVADIGDTAPMRTTPVADLAQRPDWPPERRAARTAFDPALRQPAGRSRLDVDSAHRPADEADVPTDEPPRQRTPRSDAELIARLPAEVLVVDGRPRYHVAGCPHLLDRDAEPLPVSEAVELGFSPCGWCQPDTVLLGGTPES